MNSADQDHLERVKQQIRDDFATRCTQGHSDARAIELVAIDLQLSLDECCATVGREDLAAELGHRWTLDLPDVGPPTIRRPR